jgi:hypothetical protein
MVHVYGSCSLIKLSGLLFIFMDHVMFMGDVHRWYLHVMFMFMGQFQGSCSLVTSLGHVYTHCCWVMFISCVQVQQYRYNIYFLNNTLVLFFFNVDFVN